MINYNRIVNDKFYKKEKIPPYLSEWNNFSMLQVKVLKRLKKIISSGLPSILYNSPADNIETFKNNFEPSSPIQTLNSFHYKGVYPFFKTYVYINPYNPEENILHVDESGLGMYRDYYLKRKYNNVQKRYKEYIRKVLEEMGYEDKSSEIYDIEKELAKNRLSVEKGRRSEIISVLNRRKLYEMSFPWREYFKFNVNKVLIANIKYFNFLGEFIYKVNKEDLFYYYIFQAINKYGKFVSRKVKEERFEFYGKFLVGLKKEKPEKVLLISNLFPDIVGKKYIEKYFDDEDKENVELMCKNIKKAFKDNLQTIDWMSPITKKKVIEKLNNINFNIGYPDKWKIEEEIPNVNKKNGFLTNLINTKIYRYRQKIKSLKKKVNRKKWNDSCFTVNAFYEPYTNTITIPAGIIQKPFYYKNSLEKSYGSLGRTIGHELTHAFDDEGRKYDKNGKLRNWWLKKDIEKFKRRTNRIVKLYNSKKTLGENIADMGGLKLAFIAFQKAYFEKYKNKPTEKEYEDFFISFIKSKRNLSKKKISNIKLLLDVHSPDSQRINIPLNSFFSGKNISVW